jgi:hypothetical protein
VSPGRSVFSQRIISRQQKKILDEDNTEKGTSGDVTAVGQITSKPAIFAQFPCEMMDLCRFVEIALQIKTVEDRFTHGSTVTSLQTAAEYVPVGRKAIKWSKKVIFDQFSDENDGSPPFCGVFSSNKSRGGPFYLWGDQLHPSNEGGMGPS